MYIHITLSLRKGYVNRSFYDISEAFIDTCLMQARFHDSGVVLVDTSSVYLTSDRLNQHPPRSLSSLHSYLPPLNDHKKAILPFLLTGPAISDF